MTRRGALMNCTVGIVMFAGMVLGIIACRGDGEQPARQASEQFLAAIRSGSFEDAHALTSKIFQEDRSAKRLRRDLVKVRGLMNHKSVTLKKGPTCDSQRCNLEGHLEPGGIPVTIWTGKEGGRHVIDRFSCRNDQGGRAVIID